MLPTATRQFKTVPLPEIIMSQNPTESKYLLSHVIAEWACALKYKDLSPAAIQAAKLFWFDSIGCALGGSQQDDAKILLKHYRAMSAMADSSGGERGGKGNATAFVSGFKTNPVDAAFLNGHMIRAMDYNDIYWKADPCHPSDLIAAPLALCESEGLSGRDLILATIIAYEIEMRFCEIGRPGVREYGWHHATLSAFAAPVAAGRALNLTPEQMVSAIGISASRTFCPGAVTAGKLTNMKNTVDPWAGRMGAESALLARDGFSGPEHIIDGKEGLFAVFKHVQYKGQPAAFDGEAFVKDLPNSKKSHYRILDCGMKSFPVEALSHAPLTAMMKTVKEHKIKANDVKEIKVEVIARAADILGDPHKYRPDSKETADHSLPYCMAAGLVDGMVTPLQFKEERVLDKALIPIMDKVKVVANEEFEALFPKFQPSRVTITTNDGKSHSTRVDVPKGDPRDPMTEDEIAVKFTALGGDVIGRDQCKKLQKCIMSIETADKLDGLFALTTAR
ncbi:MAG: MmgE/PrpD family protein [Verrucomicrobia bacterium]|nr:MAG: MmgE/PrpD family protein [Verrucomicrobiota bacterium]PYL88459.1 MAG: MmgE/PrpD family protein [Verrucomicrobiota bacterium]